MKKIFLLATLLSSSVMAQNQLTLYFIPSPKGMDWSSPANLAWSALRNRLSFQSHFMGHVLVELECGKRVERTGMIGKNFDYLNQLLLHGRGLGILYHSFEGAMEQKDDVEKEIHALSLEPERMNFARFKLNEAQCARGLTYLAEYREKNVGRYYGLANRPLYGEGAGCSAFGASVAEVTGVLSTEIRHAWSQSVDIPLTYAGPPLRDESVNLIKLMLNASRWAKQDEPLKRLVFWSPDKMHEWVKQKLETEKAGKQFTVLELGKTKGLVFDRSDSVAPEGPIWLQHLDASLKKKAK